MCVMDSGERDSLFKILDAVVELDSNDRKEFAKILEITRLKQVVSTIKLISDRLLTLENLKKIVFNHTLQANEVRDLQSFIEKHYWIFGEEYRMVCAEEVKFEEAYEGTWSCSQEKGRTYLTMEATRTGGEWYQKGEDPVSWSETFCVYSVYSGSGLLLENETENASMPSNQNDTQLLEAIRTYG